MICQLENCVALHVRCYTLLGEKRYNYIIQCVPQVTTYRCYRDRAVIAYGHLFENWNYVCSLPFMWHGPLCIEDQKINVKIGAISFEHSLRK